MQSRRLEFGRALPLARGESAPPAAEHNPDPANRRGLGALSLEPLKPGFAGG